MKKHTNMTKPSSAIALALIFLSIATSYALDDAFLKCLIKHNEHFEQIHPISEAICTKTNSSYSHVLQLYIRNLRFNKSSTPKPEFIFTALRVSHIQAGIVCSKKHGLEMRIRSGGHDFEGSSYVSHINPSNFFILDMNRFRIIDIELESETAWVGVGATLGEIYHGIAEKSDVHAFPAGVCPTVGVGGHFSGGGYGTLMRKYGLSVDNIIDTLFVDVNGRVLNRSSMGEDLFWALNGGGGSSFGVILTYQIKLVRVPPKLTTFRIEKLGFHHTTIDIAHRWQEVAHTLHKDLFIRMIIGVARRTRHVNETRPHLHIKVTFMALFLGDASSLLPLMAKSFPEMGLQRNDCIEKKWVETLTFFALFPPTTPISILLDRHSQKETYLKMKSDYLKKPMPKQGLKLLFKKMVEWEGPFIEFNPYGGRMSEIPSNEKPFPHRKGNIAKIQYMVVWSEDGEKEENHYIKKMRHLYKWMTPYVSKAPREAFYNYKDLDLGAINNHTINIMEGYFEGKAYGTKYFKDNYSRLVEIKSKVDPDNFFKNEQSIPTKIPSNKLVIPRE